LATGALVTGALVLGGLALFRPDLPETASPPPRYVEESLAAGLDHVYDGEFEFFVGGGVAVFDCDDDGQPDMYLAGGENPAGLYRNVGEVGGPLAFEYVTADGVALTEATGAYPVDIDSDGLTDLAVLRVGEDVMLRGLGDCAFEPANEAWSLEGADDWTVGFSAIWEDEESLPTLAFGNYLAEGGQTPASHAQPRLLHPVHPLLGLGPLGSARPAHDQRPSLLPQRRGTVVAGRPGRGSAPLHPGGRLADDADLGHGYRRP
jgi:hypothetical protein